jgi:Ca2+-binding RTX toxin-like protein
MRDTLFTATDPDGDAIVSYQFRDVTSGTGSGNFVIGGVAQGPGLTGIINDLSSVQFTSGTTSGDTLLVRAFDGIAWGGWTTFSVDLTNSAPVITAPDVSLGKGVTVDADTLFTATDLDGDAIVSYQFLDVTSGTGSGNFVIGGVAQGPGLTGIINDLSSVQFTSGTTSGDTLLVRAFDGIAWGGWTTFSVDLTNSAPVITAPDVSLGKGVTVDADTLFTATDLDGDAIVSYQFRDVTSGTGSGNFVIGGVAQGPGLTGIINDLSSVQFTSGTTSGDTLLVRAFDGIAWGGWTTFSVDLTNSAPVITAPDVSLGKGVTVDADTLFTATDPDGDAIVSYQFRDVTSGTGSGNFVIGGVAQGPGLTGIINDLSSVQFTSGTTSGDTLLVRAFDGIAWGGWTTFSVDLTNSAPVITAPDVSLGKGVTVDADTLFTATDPDGDAIVSYQFRDVTSGTGSGNFVIGGVAQGPGLTGIINDLSSVQFTSGTTSGDTLLVRAFDGIAWGDWATFSVTIPTSNIITGTNDDDFLVGTSGDDLIQPLDATPEVGDTIVASGGNDEIDFAGSVDGFYNVNYHTLGVGIDATIGATTASLIKSGIGTDTWSNVDQINGNAGGVTLRTSSQNDTFNVDTTGLEWLALRVGGGTDTITRTGTGTLRVDLRGYDGVTIDAGANTATEVLGASSTTVTGFVDEWRGSFGDDTITGSAADERFITELGNDFVDGGGGGLDFDLLRYDRFFVDQGGGSTNIVVDMTGAGSGTVSGTWFGQFFTDTFTDIERIRGSQVGIDVFNGNSGNDQFEGRGGINFFQGEGGDDLLIAGGDGNLFAFNSVPGGFGTDTIRNFVVGRDLIDAIEQGPPGTYTITYDGVSGNSTVVTAGGTIIIEGVDITGVPLGDIFVENENMSATGGDDNLSGTSQNDKIDGEAGNDTINGNDGNDILLSGGATLDFNGFDVLRGGSGNDVLVSEGGASSLRGDAGNDTMIATNEFGDGYWDFARADYNNSPAGIIANLTSGTPTSGPGGTPPAGIPGPMQIADGWGTIDTISGIHVIRDSNNDDFIYVDGSYTNNYDNFIEVRLSGGNDFVDFTGMTGQARVSWQNAADGVSVTIDASGNGTAVDNNLGDGDQIGTDTFINANYLRGSNFDDVLDGSSSTQGVRFRGSGGNDTIIGGTGDDRADYISAGSGITVDLTLGSNQVSDDGQGGVDNLTSIEDIRGSEFNDSITGDGNDNLLIGLNGDDLLAGGGGDDQLIETVNLGGLLGGDDTLIGGTGNDFMRGGDGADTYVFASGDGNDTIDDFSFADGDRIDITAYGFTSNTDFASFSFDGTNTIVDFDGTNVVTFNNVDLTALPNPDDAFIFSGGGGPNIITGTNDDDFLVGTSGDDLIQPLDATPEVGDTIVASGGNDEIDFAGSVDGFYNVNYHTLGVGINATIGVTTASLIKSGIGTDTWSNVDQINGNAGGVTLRTSSQNDTFNVDTTGLEWLALRVGGGTDTITRTGTGTLRVDLRGYNGVAVDATTNTATEIGGSSTTTVTGFVNEWRGSAGDDTFLGTGSDERFITEGGVNVIDGGGSGVDTDLLRYDRFFVDQGGGSTNILVQMNGVNSGTVTGTWFGQFFTDTFTDIEQIRGSQVGVTQFVGASGNDEFYGVGGANYFEGNGGDDLFVAGGDANIFAFEFDPGGFGTDTIRNFVVGRDLIDAIEQGPPGTYTITYDGVSGNSTVVTAGGTIIIEGVDITGVPLGDIFIENENMSATGGDDNLSGTSQNDKIDGEAGNDTINGNDGNDILLSGGATLDFNGFDVLRGGNGNDVLVSEGGASSLRGDAGNDTIIATNEFGDGYWDWARADYSNSPAGIIANLMSGTPTSGPGGTPPAGIPGPMQIADGWGTIDTISGIHLLRDSNNDDYIYVDGSYANSFGNFFEARLSGGNDFVDFTGMTGTARVSWQNAEDGVVVSIDNAGNGTATDNNSNPANNATDEIGIDTFIGANYLRGSSYDDVFNGSDNNDRFRGSAGNDTINGGLGDEDQVDHNDSPNAINVDLALGSNQVINDGFGTSDTLTSIENVAGSDWDDIIRGDGNSNFLLGRQGNDLLEGRGGDDQLIDVNNAGGLLGGDDTLIGGTGNDFMRGGDGADTFVFAAGDGADIIDDFNFADGDRIDISAYGFASTAEFIIDTGTIPSSTILDFGGGDMVTLNGFDITSIGNANDAFIFNPPQPPFINNWAFVANLSDPADSATATEIRWTNSDNTVTELYGTGFTFDVNGDPTGGNVEGMRRYDTDGTTLLEEYSLGSPSSVPLTDAATLIGGAGGIYAALSTWGLDSYGDIVDFTQSPTQIDLVFAGGEKIQITGSSLSLQSSSVAGFGTVDRIELIDSDGTTQLQDTGTGLATSTAALLGLFNAGAFEEIILYAPDGSTFNTGPGAGVGFGGIEYLLLQGTTSYVRTSAFGEGVAVVQGFGGANTIDDQSTTAAISVNVVYFNSPDAITATMDSTLGGATSGTVVRGGVTDTISGVRELDGGLLGDIIIGTDDRDSVSGGRGNDTITLNAGNDDYLFTVGEGIDTITDFTPGAGSDDRIIVQDFQGVNSFADVIALASDNGSDTTIDFGNGDQLILQGVLVAQLHEDDFFIDSPVNIITGTDGDDVFTGTAGNDLIETLDATPDYGDEYFASGGDDTVDFAGSVDGFYNMFYGGLGVNLTANIGANSGTIDKDGSGTDSWINVDQINGLDGGVYLFGGGGDDVYNIDATGTEWFGVRVGTGTDQLNVSGTGLVRADFRNYNGVTIDAVVGTASEIGGSSSTTITGTVWEWRGSNSADSMTGSGADESFITERGNDTVDGGGGFDRVRYDRAGVENIIVQFTAPGTATVTGTWSGQSFTDSLSNIEWVRGSNDGVDQFYGSGGDERFDGAGGHNFFDAGAGNDDMRVSGSSTFNLFAFSTGSGSDVIYGFDDTRDIIDVTGYGYTDFSSITRTYTTAGSDVTYGGVGYTTVDFGGGNSVDVVGVDISANDAVFNLAGGLNIVLGTNGDDTLAGTAGDDAIFPIDNTGLGDVIGVSAGDDLISFAGASANAFYDLSYNSLGGVVGLTVNINAADGTIVKSGLGTDTIADLDRIGDQGLFLRADNGANDSFTLTNVLTGFMNIRIGGGTDTFSYDNSGFVRLDFRGYSGVDIDLSGGTPVINEIGGSSSLSIVSGLPEQWRLSSGADDFTGTAFTDVIITEQGNDTVDGAGGIDLARYDRSGVDGISVSYTGNVATVTGVWGGAAFTDTLTDVEQIRGNNNVDAMTGDTGDEIFDGRGNDDVLNGGGGADILIGNTGDDTLTGGAGADTFVFRPGDGFDEITDFNFGDGDRIDVTAFGFATAADFSIDGATSPGNLIIDFNGLGEVTLTGPDLTGLVNDDDAFIFV